MDKRSIVLTSNFTQQNHHGFGNSPGAFLKDYVARDEATEAWDNEMLNIDDDAVLSDNGRVFGGEGLVYDDTQIDAAAEMFDRAYQNGQTVQRMVVSFDTDYDYLKHKHAMSDFKHQHKGDFENQVDELKLRSAITNGVNQMVSRGQYQEPYWAGSVQVNTDHVHSHIVLCDKDPKSRVRKQDGEQQGSFTQQEMDAFKQGVSDYFNDSYALDADATMLQTQAQYVKQKQRYQNNQAQRIPTMRKYQDPNIDDQDKNQALKQFVNVTPQDPVATDDYMEAARILQGKMQRSKKRKQKYLKQYQQRYEQTLTKIDTLAKRFERSSGALQDFYQGELEYQMQVFDRYRRYLGNPPDKIDPPKTAFDEWRNGHHDRNVFQKERNQAIHQIITVNQETIPDLDRDLQRQQRVVDGDTLAYNQRLQSQRASNARTIINDPNLSGIDKALVFETLNESVNASQILEQAEIQAAQSTVATAPQPTVSRERQKATSKQNKQKFDDFSL